MTSAWPRAQIAFPPGSARAVLLAVLPFVAVLHYDATMAPSSTLARTHSVRVRLGIAGGLLLLEYLAISFAFDAKRVGARGGAWAVLGEVGSIGPLLVVAATALLLLPSLEPADPKRRLPSISVLLLGLHACLGAGFLWLTRAAFGSDEAPRGPALFWLLGWATAGVATAASLLVGVVGEWRALWRMLVRAVAAGGSLGLAAWAAGAASTRLWHPLSYATFVTVTTLLHWLSFDLWVVDAEHFALQLDDFAVIVAPVCSGFEGIGLFAVLMGGFLYRFRSTLRFPNALWLLPLGMAAVWFGNALRIAALMIVGARLDPAIAVGSFHSKAGWVFFCAITLAVAALGRRLPFFAKRDGSDADGEVSHDNPTAPLLLPVLCWIGIGLVTSTFSEGHDPLYALRVVGSGLVLALYRDSYRAWLVRPALLSFGVGAAVGVAWLLPLPGAPSADSIVLPVPEWSAAAYASWIAFRIVGAVVVVPSCEELAFRGYLMRWLTKREFWDVPFASVSLFAITLSSLVFGLLHDRWLLGAASGVVYAWLVRRSGRLSDGVAAHAASNLVIAAWVLATGQFQHW